MTVTVPVVPVPVDYAVLLPGAPPELDEAWPALIAEVERAVDPELADAARALKAEGRLRWLPRRRQGWALFPRRADRAFAVAGLPSLRMLRMLRMGELEDARHRACRSRVVLGTTALPVHGWAPQRAVRALAAAAARLHDGLVVDLHAGRALPVHFDEPVVIPGEPLDMSPEILVPMSARGDGTLLLTTVGLTRFGLPNLALVGVPEALGQDAGRVLNATAAALVDRLATQAAGRGALAVDTVTLTAALWHDADGDALVGEVGLEEHAPFGGEVMLRLHPPADPAGDVGAWLAEVVARIPVIAPVADVAGDDAELVAAETEARRRLPEVHARWTRGELEGKLAVKSGFATPEGSREHMWAQVRGWDDGRIVAVLDNQPRRIPGLSQGDVVRIDAGDVSDWTITHDHQREGGFTVEVLMRRYHGR